jgi:hypothetical protein
MHMRRTIPPLDGLLSPSLLRCIFWLPFNLEFISISYFPVFSLKYLLIILQNTLLSYPARSTASGALLLWGPTSNCVASRPTSWCGRASISRKLWELLALSSPQLSPNLVRNCAPSPIEVLCYQSKRDLQILTHKTCFINVHSK